MRPLLANCLRSKHCSEIAPAVHNADDLDLVDRAFVSVGVRLVENEVSPLYQDARTRPYVRAAPTKSGIVNKHVRLGLNRGVKPLCRVGAGKTDGGVNIAQVFTCPGDAR
jgi:hypothetical protein